MVLVAQGLSLSSRLTRGAPACSSAVAAGVRWGDRRAHGAVARREQGACGLHASSLTRRAHVTRATQQQQQQQASSTSTDEDLGEYGGESFYEILGVPPDAEPRDIKRAYYALMRTCHPDQSGDDEEGSATEFCALLNDIYDTLMDAPRRAVYDDLAGFSTVSTNPFVDGRAERDMVFVDEFTCIGCRNCNNVCPKTFGMEEDWGRARVYNQKVDTDQKLQEAIDTCPVSCIHWVSAPQLSLLEAAMARSERVAVYSLMMGGGRSFDVFQEASTAWQKRFSAIQERRQAASYARVVDPARDGPSWADGLGGLWGKMRDNVDTGGSGGSKAYAAADAQRARQAEEAAAGNSGEVDVKAARGIASLAAKAARASRSWRVYQEFERSRRGAEVMRSLGSVSSESSMDDVDGLDPAVLAAGAKLAAAAARGEA